MFDSGSGGLTVLSALRKKAPETDVVYFGDVAHMPYGEKTETELTELTRTGVRVLQEKGAQVLVSACNSVSASVLQGVAGTMPYIEMSLPTALYLQQYKGQRFLLIATPATVASGLYEKATEGIVSLDALPIPHLARAIESNYPKTDIEEILRDAFASRKGEAYNGLILGCTHYPFVRGSIEQIAHTYFGPLEIIDPAYPVAETVCTTFNIVGSGITNFFVSKESPAFEKKIQELFPTRQYEYAVIT